MTITAAIMGIRAVSSLLEIDFVALPACLTAFFSFFSFFIPFSSIFRDRTGIFPDS